MVPSLVLVILISAKQLVSVKLKTAKQYYYLCLCGIEEQTVRTIIGKKVCNDLRKLKNNLAVTYVKG